MVPPILEAKSIVRIYFAGDTAVHALKECSLTISQGEFVAIMGPSGSGKSTLMNLLGLLDRPTEGQLFIDGILSDELSLNQRAQFRSQMVGFIFQSFNLLPRQTAVENVELPMIYMKVSRKTRRTKALAALKDVGLLKRKDHYPNQLSGGEQQRVAIARSVVNKPRLVLADEPTGALDSKTGIEVLRMLQNINASGQAVVMITHDDFVARHAARIVRMKDGQILSDEPVNDRLVAYPESAELGSNTTLSDSLLSDTPDVLVLR